MSGHPDRRTRSRTHTAGRGWPASLSGPGGPSLPRSRRNTTLSENSGETLENQRQSQNCPHERGILCAGRRSHVRILRDGSGRGRRGRGTRQGVRRWAAAAVETDQWGRAKPSGHGNFRGEREKELEIRRTPWSPARQEYTKEQAELTRYHKVEPC